MQICNYNINMHIWYRCIPVSIMIKYYKLSLGAYTFNNSYPITLSKENYSKKF